MAYCGKRGRPCPHASSDSPRSWRPSQLKSGAARFYRIMDEGWNSEVIWPVEYRRVDAVTAAPGPAGVRVREVMSRGRGPRVGCPPPAGVDVAYPPRITRKDLDEFVALAKRMASELAESGAVLEVAPWPGYFAIELARAWPIPDQRARHQPDVRRDRAKERGRGGRVGRCPARRRRAHAVRGWNIRPDRLPGDPHAADLQVHADPARRHREELAQFVSQSGFEKSWVEDTPIGFELWLTK